ncbi:GPP34 family phosphoprotein [Micromonospora sp. NPDC007271]|uniref:GOLPH3/VPS74 family protein n=1 Tax=Micromonospora sp. NPDC007271 TaxID=3154587 RepID=UPI0033D4914E
MTGVALAEELLLLAYDDETGKATMPRISLDLGMAAAVLVELALAGRIAYVEGSLAVIDPAPTGEPIADEVLARIAADTPHTPSSWVQRLRHGLRDRILGDLCGRGVVRDVDETELGFIHVHRYPVVDASVEADSRRRLAAALTGGQLPDERTAALATLVAVLRMEPTLGLTGEDARDAHRRLEEIAGVAGFSGTVSRDDSVVRPSVSLVVAALAQAVDAALGKRHP